MTAPLWLRKFILDFAETALGLLFALALVFPATLEDAQKVAVVVGGSLLAALVSAARRAIPGFLLWLGGVLGVPPSA